VTTHAPEKKSPNYIDHWQLVLRRFVAKHLSLYTVLFIFFLTATGIWLAPRISEYLAVQRAGGLLDQAWSDKRFLPCDNPSLSPSQHKNALLAQQTSNLEQSNNRQLLLIHARAACLTGDTQAALDSYLSFLEQQPTNALIWAELGIALEKNGDIPGAIQAWQTAGISANEMWTNGSNLLAADELTPAEASLNRAIALDPQFSNAWETLGDVYTASNLSEKAENAYLTAAELGSVRSITELINIYENAHNLTLLEKTLLYALDTHPNHIDRLGWWRLLGETQRNQQNPSTANVTYQDAIREFPNDATLLIGLAYTNYEAKRDLDGALAILQDVVQMNPEHGLAYYATADLLNKAGQFEDANLWFAQAVEKNPNVAWWQFRWSENYAHQGNTQLAFEVASNLVENFPQFDLGYLKLANYQSSQGETDQAMETLALALERLQKPSVRFLIGAGQLFSTLGDSASAIMLYRQVLALEPDNQIAQQRLSALTESLR
jgi:tetratricopeptide (TPR) repeat protein